MPTQSPSIQTRKENAMACLTVTAGTLKILANGLNTPLSVAISNTIQSLLKSMVVSHSRNPLAGDPHPANQTEIKSKKLY
jgi:hypothetical protein